MINLNELLEIISIIEIKTAKRLDLDVIMGIILMLKEGTCII
jgi:hypothetical protein